MMSESKVNEGNVSEATKEGNVSTTPAEKPPVRDLDSMPMTFHGSIINAIETTAGREFELDGVRYVLPGDAITAARMKKVNSEKASTPTPLPTPATE
jgi:hypothetical protein